MKAAGKWSWWNQYGSVSVDDCVERAKMANLDGVIVKAGYWNVMVAFKRAGIPVAVEAYVYPTSPADWGQELARGVDLGAQFVVINAETEWESEGSGSMGRLIATIEGRHPGVELYASVDTRGNRTSLPYQRVLARHITGWMPMIYPLAFFPRREPGWLGAAFRNCLDSGQDFAGKPVLPTIQTYGGIGAPAIEGEIRGVHRRRLPGYQAYTICHATDEEWRVIVADDWYIPDEEEDTDMAWLDETITGFDGKPLMFEVVQGDLSTRKQGLTRKEYITLSALKLIMAAHGHRARTTIE